MMDCFDTTIQGEDCTIHVLWWEPFRPAYISGPPEDCYPDEGGFGEWVVLTPDHEPWPELSDAMTDKDISRIDAEVFRFMEVDRMEMDP